MVDPGHRPQRRLVGVAVGPAHRAAGREGAARGEVDQRRRRPPDGGERLVTLGVQPREAAEQPQRVRHPRVVVDGVGLADLNRLAGVHDQHPVGHPGHHPEVVGDQHDRRRGALLHAPQGVQDLRLDGHVQGGGRLVGDDHVRVVGHRHGDDGPLPHPAGELVRVVPGPVGGVGDADQVEQLHGPGPGLGFADVLVGQDRLLELPADRVHGVQAGHGVLEDHGDLLAPDSGLLLVGQPEQVAAAEVDLAADAGRAGKQAHDRQGGHALAGARLADDPQHLPRLEGIADAPHGVDDAVVGGEVDGQVLDLEHRHGGHQARTLVWVGSKASRSPSPMKFTVSAMITMNKPGNQNSHGRVVAAC